MTAALAALFGLAFGSFANAAIDRLATGRPLTGRSACDACRRELAPWELIPIASYVALRGRCAGCGSAIGVRAPLFEAASGLGFAAAFAALPAAPAAALCAAAVAAVIATGAALCRRCGA